MEYANLGKTGLKVSRICLGAMSYGSSKWRKWVLDEEESRPFFKRAIELGINFFDTADMYSSGLSEEVTGRALRDGRRMNYYRQQSRAIRRSNRGGLCIHILRSIDLAGRGGSTTASDSSLDRIAGETLEALNDVVRLAKRCWSLCHAAVHKGSYLAMHG
jgi:hypothetical protein